MTTVFNALIKDNLHQSVTALPIILTLEWGSVMLTAKAFNMITVRAIARIAAINAWLDASLELMTASIAGETG